MSLSSAIRRSGATLSPRVSGLRQAHPPTTHDAASVSAFAAGFGVRVAAAAAASCMLWLAIAWTLA